MTPLDARLNLGRMVAGIRFIMALMFGLWVWIDPSQPAREQSLGYSLFVSYVVFASLLVPIAWRDWWTDFRLQDFTLFVDCVVFIVAVYFTESGAGDFTSPYFAFFAFLVLRARLRWQWRPTLLLAVALIGAYLLAGMILHWIGLDVDMAKFVRRVSYMGLLSILLTWLVAGRLAPAMPRFSIRPDAVGFPYSAALDYAMKVTGAKGGVLLWSPQEEPHTDVQFGGDLGNQAKKLPPGYYAGSLEATTFVIDRERQRYLIKREDQPIKAKRGMPSAAVVHECHVPSGLLVQIVGSTGSGELLLSGVPALSADSLATGRAIAREIEIALAEAEIATNARDASISRVRVAVARDLHDSVAQSLAGARFGLNALMRKITTEANPVAELERIDDALASEQAQVRSLIERLRRGEVAAGDCDVHAELEPLVAVLQQQWQVEIHLGQAKEGNIVSRLLMLEIQQLIREAVANSVRHGEAKTIWIEVNMLDRNLVLSCTDDGLGFENADPRSKPRSLSERLETIDGALTMDQQEGATRLVFTIPLKARS